MISHKKEYIDTLEASTWETMYKARKRVETQSFTNEQTKGETKSNLSSVYERNKRNDKGAWGMPRLSEAKKDVTSCEKRRGGANTH